MSSVNLIKVLMIDDDEVFTDAVKSYFLAEGNFVFTCKHDGSSGKESALLVDYDVIILDVTMPGMNGFEVLKYIRRRKDTPVIMLTARGDDFDRILGFEIGADDYVPKPCTLRELVARVKAIMRRTYKRLGSEPIDNFEDIIVVSDLTIKLGSLSVEKDGVPVVVTSTEFMVLEKLMSSAGEVVSKDEIARHALGRRISTFDRSVDAHIVSLRRKLGPMPDGQQRIKTVRGRGYLYVLV